MSAAGKPVRPETAAVVETIRAIAEAIRALGSVPSGHLYAQVMGYLSLEQYQRVVSILKGAGLVEEDAHLLRWVGPPAS